MPLQIYMVMRHTTDDVETWDAPIAPYFDLDNANSRADKEAMENLDASYSVRPMIVPDAPNLDWDKLLTPLERGYKWAVSEVRDADSPENEL